MKTASKSKQKWTVAIRATKGCKPRKITKIVGLNGGGLSVITPYHRARSGFLFKHLMDLNTLGKRKVFWNQCVAFTADDRAKLTYHIDGFAQFSSENPGKIISGRDPQTGEPKGLGLLARPFKTPSVSGPSIGITVWGIEDFDTASGTEELVVFEPSDFYYRNCTPETANCWHLAVYVFATRGIPPVRYEGTQAVMDFLLNPISAGVQGAVVKLKAIHLEAEEVYLGLHIERFVGSYPVKSGWILNGPGNYTAYQSGYVLQAIYPRDLIPVEGRPSLDRN